MIAQLDIDKYQRLMKDYATTDRNCRLASPKGFTAIVRKMEELIPEYYPSISQTDYLNFIMNTIWYNREFLGKSGHELESDCRKCLGVVGQASTGIMTGLILIPEVMPDDERARVQAALAKYRASQHTNGGKTVNEPTPEPSNQTPLTTSEPTEPVEPAPIKTYAFNKPTRPGYIIPEEYPMIHYALSTNTDICLVGDASAGKSLTIDVMCEAEHWNLVQIGKVTDDTMLKGFMNPITKEYTPSKLVRALQRDPELCPYDGQKVVICFDEGFTNMADYLTTLLTLVGTPEYGYLATEWDVIPRGDTVFVFIDNSTGDGGTTNFISRKPIDMALKSRLFFIEMKLSPKIAKAICAEDKDLLNFTKWMRGAIGRGKVDRLNLDNRGLHMIKNMKGWDSYSDEILGEILYGAFFKGCPPASMATLLRNVKATPEELKANKYFMATQAYYEKLCKSAGLKADPEVIKG